MVVRRCRRYYGNIFYTRQLAIYGLAEPHSTEQNRTEQKLFSVSFENEKQKMDLNQRL